MNCKPGDLARYVGNQLEAHGWIVMVVAPFTIALEEGRGPAWYVSPPLPPRSDGRRSDAVYDLALKPLRPGDISDEEVRDLYAPKVPEVA